MAKNCKSCKFSRPVVSNFEDASLACHRFPPAQDDTKQRPSAYPFPVVKESDWCGEHKP
jgi:hypothetical protein